MVSKAKDSFCYTVYPGQSDHGLMCSDVFYKYYKEVQKMLLARNVSLIDSQIEQTKYHVYQIWFHQL